MWPRHARPQVLRTESGTAFFGPDQGLAIPDCRKTPILRTLTEVTGGDEDELPHELSAALADIGIR